MTFLRRVGEAKNEPLLGFLLSGKPVYLSPWRFSIPFGNPGTNRWSGLRPCLRMRIVVPQRRQALARAAIDPKPGCGIARASGSPASGVGHDCRPLLPPQRWPPGSGAQSLAGIRSPADSGCHDVAKGMHSAGEADFGFEDVPDPSQHPLVEENIADLFARRARSRRAAASSAANDGPARSGPRPATPANRSSVRAV